MRTLNIEADSRRIALSRASGGDPLIVQHAPQDHRPFIHPLRAPDGQGVLTENAPGHHPWQHGLYVGLNLVNGIGYWSEGLGGNSELDGTFHPEPLAAPEVEGNCVSWQVRCPWRGPEGEPVLVEEQRWQFRDLGVVLHLDMDWRLSAEVDIEFGRYDYGGLFLRMPYRAEIGGRALNSEGLDQEQAEGQPARWVAVAMPLEDRADEAGVAIMDHPQNDGHPVPWRVDGQLGIAPSRCIAGAWTLDRGQITRNRYRIVAFAGSIDPNDLESRFRTFAGTV